MTQGLNADFVASTYAERGVAVPFTTPQLAQARMRMVRKGEAEFLLPGFNGGKGVYIMPWRSLPGMVTVTLHDRLLFDEILAQEAQTPETVRAAALGVAATGVAGGDLAAAAAQSLAADRNARIAANVLLTVTLCRQAGMPPSPPDTPPLDGRPAGQEVADLLAACLGRPGQAGGGREPLRAVLAPVLAGTPQGSAAGVEALLTQIDALAALVAAVGVRPPGPPPDPAGPGGMPPANGLMPGRLRAQVAELEKLQAALGLWAGVEMADVSLLTARVAAAGAVALGQARGRLERLDARLADLRPLLLDPRPLRAAVAEEVERLTWVMDGWPYLVSLWNSAVRGSLAEQRAAVAELFRLHPQIPVREGGQVVSPLEMDSLTRIRAAWTRRREEAIIGQVDMAGVLAVEALKAGVA